MYIFDASYTMTNCTFASNSGTNGSHIFNSGSNKEINISDSEFSDGSAAFGGIMACSLLGHILI